jgi:arginine utilization protein RocB
LNNVTQKSLERSARRWAKTLLSWTSVTGTAGERDFPHKLAALIRHEGYFHDHPTDVHLLPVPNDSAGRSSLLALARGKGTEAVILTGHFDVVPIDDYGELAPLAGSPDELRHAIIDKLKQSGTNALALADLESGEFLPGRGMLDMKSGLAAGLAVLQIFAANPERRGNVLFLAVPDEENQSAGMRAAASAVCRFARDHELDLKLAIN